MARFAYVDETGTTDLDDDAQPVFRLLAIVVPEHQDRPLAAGLRKITSDYLGEQQDAELHGYEMFHGTGQWASVAVEDRIEAYRRALSLIVVHDVDIAHTAIDKRLLRQKYSQPLNPYLLALQFLCEKLNDLRLPEVKVLVADEKKEEMFEAVSMVSDLARLNHGVLQALPTNRIFEHLVYLDSRQCPGIQLADLAAYMRQRPRGEGDARVQAIVAEFQQLVSNAVRTYRFPWPAA